MDIPDQYKKNIYLALLVFLILLSLYFAVKFLSEIRSYTLFTGSENSAITLSGHGEVSAVPDIANVYFTISKDAKTVKEAQSGVAEIEKKTLQFLRESNILDKDFKTTNSSFYPKYEYQYNKIACPVGYNCPPSSKSIVVGYTASESITVKVRNTDDVAKIMQGLGTLGVSNLNGPNFSIDDEDGYKREARQEAIADAKKKAEQLAKDLGVTLVKITSFSESGNYPMPMYAKTEAMGRVADSSSTAEIPKGENTITSDVSITYEIR